MFAQSGPRTEFDRKRAFEALTQLAVAIQAYNLRLLKAWEIAYSATAPARELYHVPIMALVNHVFQCLDAVEVMVSRGVATPARSLLRSALEGMFGIMYMLKEDRKDRALSYAVCHLHNLIESSKLMDPNSDKAKRQCAELKNDPMLRFFNEMSGIDSTAEVSRIEGILNDSLHKYVELEYQAVKKGRSSVQSTCDASCNCKCHQRKRRRSGAVRWYSLFNGPSDVRELARRVGRLGLYDVFYRTWSDTVHAASALHNIEEKYGRTFMRQVRHPEHIPVVTHFVVQIVLELSECLIKAYDPSAWPAFVLESRKATGDHLRAIVGGHLFEAIRGPCGPLTPLEKYAEEHSAEWMQP